MFWFGLVLLGIVESSDPTRLDLVWEDNSDSEQGYEIERSLDGVNFELLTIVGADVICYSDESVVPGLEYVYRVRAFNEVGYSTFSNVSGGVMPNSLPTLSTFEDISYVVGDTAPELEFEYGDSESGLEDLAIWAVSSNEQLLPSSSITLEYADGAGTVSFSPLEAAFGVATVTLYLSDEADEVGVTFEFEVRENSKPMISALFSSQQTHGGGTAGPMILQILDDETEMSQLEVSAYSLTPEKVADDEIELSVEGEYWSIYATTMRGAEGTATLRVIASDGTHFSEFDLDIEILPKQAPEMDGLEPVYRIAAGGMLSVPDIALSDLDSDLSDLEVSFETSNPLLIPLTGIEFVGVGELRTLTISPAARLSGASTVRVGISDGEVAAEYSFTVVVEAPQVSLEILDLSVVHGFARITVNAVELEELQLWTSSPDAFGVWKPVENALVEQGESEVTFVYPELIEGPVYFQVTVK